ncbi:hypothetical protein ACFVS2_21125 [Brevibacillus sp. NPDC058079]|uniref:hypothetical protein n=1 Tax=Brevibacillus sp. NPDC058079 TaxID=3346330 RepID=UPI0036F00114
MTTYGYGGTEEALYLKAYELAKSGKATLLFSFESDKTKLYKILASHILQIPIKDVTLEKITELKEKILSEGDLPFTFVDVASMPLDEISETIGRNKANKNITEVVFDRIDDQLAIDNIAKKLGINAHY